MMPLVFSATASSMPALAASPSTNSFMLPRLDRFLTGSPCSEIHLGLRKYEIQATNRVPGAIHLHSRRKCCSHARAEAKFCTKCRGCQWRLRLLADDHAGVSRVSRRKTHV